jgi:hypothetical protein
MPVRWSRECPWWLYICSQLGFISSSCLLLQVKVLGLAGCVYPSSGLLSWQEPGRPISRTEGSYPRHHARPIVRRSAIIMNKNAVLHGELKLCMVCMCNFCLQRCLHGRSFTRICKGANEVGVDTATILDVHVHV